MFSMIRQRRASFSHVNSIGIQKNSFNSFELYHLRRNSSTLSVIVLLNLTVIPLKITLTISLGSSPCTTALIPLNSTIFVETLALFSHCLIEFNSDPIKDYSDHILREFSLYNPIILDYLWDLLNSVIGKNCNLFRNIIKSFPELSNFII